MEQGCLQAANQHEGAVTRLDVADFEDEQSSDTDGRLSHPKAR